MEKNRWTQWLAFMCVMYPIYVIGVVIVLILRLTGRVRIKYAERLPRCRRKMIIAPNHPSLWEPILLVFLFPLEGLFHPHQAIPWSTPDERNYNKWYWTLLYQRFIFVPRGEKRRERNALLKIVRVLRAGHRVILFGEGGRSYRGDRYHKSASGGYIRELKPGLARAACLSGAGILPVWIKGADHVLPYGAIIPRFWRPVTITIGEYVPVKRSDRKKERFRADVQDVTKVITKSLLRASEE